MVFTAALLSFFLGKSPLTRNKEPVGQGTGTFSYNYCRNEVDHEVAVILTKMPDYCFSSCQNTPII